MFPVRRAEPGGGGLLVSCSDWPGVRKVTEESPGSPIPRLAVLVVEDDREQRESLCAMLDLEGFEHAEAANGRTALDYLDRSGAPCLVLLDLEMPMMNGWDFREKQLADESLSDIPLVVVTANGKGLNRHFPGAVGFLWKPLKFEKVVAVLERMCIRKKDVPPAPGPATEKSRRRSLFDLPETRVRASRDTIPRTTAAATSGERACRRAERRTRR